MERLFAKIIRTFDKRDLPIEQRLSNRMIQMGALAALGGMIICLVAHTHFMAVVITGAMAITLPATYAICAKYDKIKLLQRIILIEVVLIMPFLWIFGGGIESGMILWLVFEVLFLSVSLTGIIQKIAVAVSIILGVGAYFVVQLTNFKFPLESERDVVVSIFGSLAVVTTIIYYMTNYEKELYAHEFSLVEEKNGELIKYAEEADKANKSQKIFLANMSHEVRSPMNVVLGFNSLIEESNNIDEIHEFSRNIDSAGKSLLVVINDILDFSKIEAGKLVIYPQPYAFDELVTLSRASVEILCKHKNLEFKCEVDDSIPAGLYGDSIRLRQCITNILTNAVKYTDSGYVLLTFKNLGIDENNKKVKLAVSVSDTGRGISDEQKEELFTRFTRLDENTNRSIEGTGLGLALTKSILDMLGGEVLVESEVGKGSKFTILIEQDISDEANVHKAENHSIDEEQGKSISGMKVLVVDDSATNLTLMKRVLGKFEVECVLCSSGLETLERVRNEKFDVILLDHMMPNMDGVETFKRMQSMEHENKDTPVIMLTANAMSGAYEEYMQIGFNGYLSKPCQADAIKRELLKYAK